MQAFTRRSVLAGGVAGIALGTIPVSFRTKASAAGMRIRYSAASPEGKDMLVSYARAVAAMMDLDRTSPGDPRSWTFQWYTHWVQGNGAPADKQNALQTIYGGDPDSPNARLAQAMWSTCQPHFGGRSDDFLPWHRMYVYYYEQIIRELSGNPDFTLPYWDYTNPDLQALPPEFLKQDDPDYGSLWRANRDQDVNAGAPITAGHPAGSLNLNCLRSPAYGTRIGFCALLNGNPHGIVHDYVGNEQGMGAVPWAANDPIFWLHHSNVDRIWASWNTR
ncbi:MAG TPA: tyrosinase family protein, partial [Arenibaculum sp.]|nr:tyrosinase family protein [Arenibaculum sp.]